MIAPTATSFGPLCAFLSSCTWALGCSTYSRLSLRYSGFRINLTRALLSLPLFIIAAFVNARGFAPGIESFRAIEWHHFNWLLLSVVSSYAMGDIFFMLSTRSLGVPGSLAIASSYPIITALISVTFLHQSLPALKLLGLSVAILGIVLIILNDPKPVDIQLQDHDVPPPDSILPVASPLLQRKSVGIGLAVLTTICWASNSLSVSQGAIGIDSMVANSLRMVFSIVLIAIFGQLTQKQWPKPLAWITLRPVLWVFIAESFFGSFFFLYGLSRTASLVLGCMLASLAPVLSVPVALFLRLEKWSWVRSAAILLVVGGVTLLST